MKKKIILVFGDPNSINSEIIFKSWKKLNDSLKKRIYLIGSYNLISSQFKKLNYKINCIVVKNIYQQQNSKCLKIINIDIKFKRPFQISKKETSKFIKHSLTLAHKLALDNNVSGLINCAVSKSLLSNKDIGVTEFLSKKSNIKKDTEIMLIYNKKISVVPITTHINLRKVSSKISKLLILKKVLNVQLWFKKTLKLTPK